MTDRIIAKINKTTLVPSDTVLSLTTPRRVVTWQDTAGPVNITGAAPVAYAGRGDRQVPLEATIRNAEAGEVLVTWGAGTLTAGNWDIEHRLTLGGVTSGVLWTEIVVQSLFVEAAGDPVNTGLPVITGATTEGATLTATAGTWTGATPITYAYQWQRDGSNIGGATSATYVIQAADVGTGLRVLVTATNSEDSATATSAATFIPAPATAPVNTVAPTTTGSTDVGGVRSAGTGTWTGTPPISYAYQWLRNASPIAGATASSYTLQSADAGQSISVRVTATNGGGSATATSAAVAIATAANAPSFTVAASLSPATGPVGTVFTLFEGVASASPAPTLTIALTQAGVDVTSQIVGSEFTSTASGDLVLTVTASNGTPPDATSVATASITQPAPAPVLSAPVATDAGSNAVVWSVTSTSTFGTIYAAARLSTDAVLSASDIINGTGNAVATGTDTSPRADASNGGTITGLAGNTEHTIDIVHDAGGGQLSAVVSSASVLVTGASSGPFDPATLFAGAGDGALYDVSDLSTLWQDTAGTVAAVVGSPVARVDDKSGFGRNMTQVTAGARAILRQETSGRYYLEFNGTSNWYVTPSMVPQSSRCQIFAALRNENAAQSSIIVEGNGAFVDRAGNLQFGLRPSTVYVAAVNAGAELSYANFASNSRGPIPENVAAAMAFDRTDTASTDMVGTFRVNGINAKDNDNSVLTAPRAAFQDGPYYIGARTGTGSFANIRFYGLIMRFGPDLSAADFDQGEAWAADKSGATMPVQATAPLATITNQILLSSQSQQLMTAGA